MTRSPILFRVDGTSTSGWESFWRCITFSAALQRRRRPTWFLSNLDPLDLAFTVKRAGNQWLGTTNNVGTDEDLDEVIQEVRRLSPGAVIVDSANVSDSYIRAVQAEGPIVVSMDHLAAMNFPSNLVVNPMLKPGKEDYEVSPGSQVLLGTRYALVRPEIRRLRPLRAQEPAQPFRAMVALGDDDPHNQSLKLAQLLLDCKDIERVDIVVRPHHPDLPKMREVAETLPDKLEIAVEPAEVAARVVRCHFAVTAGNAWSIDLTCVGMPQLVIVQNESHWPTAQYLEEEGASTCLGWHENVSERTIRDSVQNLMEDPMERKSMARSGRYLIDGRGPDRLVNGLEVMLHRNRPVEIELAA